MNLQMTISEYLDFCQYQKRLDSKTIKAYRIDLQQFLKANSNLDILSITTGILEDYLETTAFRRKNTLRDIAVIKFNLSNPLNIVPILPILLLVISRHIRIWNQSYICTIYFYILISINCLP